MGGWRYSLQPIAGGRPAVHTHHKSKGSDALQLVCTQLIRTGGHYALAVGPIVSLAGSCVTGMHRVPVRKGK